MESKMSADVPEQLLIRAYQDIEKQAVGDLWRIVFPGAPPWNEPEQDIQRKMTVQLELFLVAHVGGQLAGTVMAGFDGHRGWIHLRAVSPEQRRSGLGKALMDAAEAGLIECGCSKVNLQVRTGNEQVISFYEKLGYGIEERVSMGKRVERV
jgi:ribosomal protein S18 acetylase RimI-like enzyme